MKPNLPPGLPGGDMFLFFSPLFMASACHSAGIKQQGHSRRGKDGWWNIEKAQVNTEIKKWSSVGTRRPARNWEGVVTSERQLWVSKWELWSRVQPRGTKKKGARRRTNTRHLPWPLPKVLLGQNMQKPQTARELVKYLISFPSSASWIPEEDETKRINLGKHHQKSLKLRWSDPTLRRYWRNTLSAKTVLNSDFAIDLPYIFSEMKIFLGQYYSHLLNYFIFTTVTSEPA